MLGLLLIFFIGRYFYQLADDYNKNKWGFAILGIVIYYAGTFVAGIFIGLFYPTALETMDSLALNLIALPVGIIFCGVLYYILERNWEKKSKIDPTSIDQIGKE
ncbi:hypothetical protein [Galbibacter pacificus]|uniref:Uncharacterized protein n=1 Tax=Galbibacter pacificus TaxID=2996052 RepID=A0ABT6FUN9_9FLAO|nr:hypothetical protein [Galbibacter pacificus]MDG3583542.1 hypothetical protein [Galbibacter pacificus]MDG3586982.1 hypothetical protein [Galbibacter pacificus]